MVIEVIMIVIKYYENRSDDCTCRDYINESSNNNSINKSNNIIIINVGNSTYNSCCGRLRNNICSNKLFISMKIGDD